ncbi:SUMF1/EgtB/PvdO family nonheme iron enzyme [Rhizobium sp. RAF56]|jgi:formylglycine-generating enzyme required for sulfatase activity/uncharacterized caspase-like protein|uniref:SUMF1/EgtB/PvdO family nonheme iron enzyme n=1 Tax=Rhizobium sp. RAF56 TaxID=3233062 RepID=UPI003F9AE013
MNENWAVCIGINGYDNLKPLGFARQDAEAISTFFSQNAFKTVYFLAEDAPPIQTDFGQPLLSRPTFGNLMRFLRVRFEQPFLEPSDNLWFFFAGHGRREREQDYLLPIDADPGDVVETGIPVRHVVERLRGSGAENVILLLDACRNDGARDGQGVGLERQRGIVTISSCSATEFSYEVDELGHGAFTYGLLEGLRLHGEHNCATVERLDNYLQNRVPEICRLHAKPRQTPCTFAEPLSKRHFILLPALALPEDTEPLKLQALEAEATGDLSLAEQLWWRIIAVDPTDAQARGAVRRLPLKIEQAQQAAKQAQTLAETEEGRREARPNHEEKTDTDEGKHFTLSRRQMIVAGGAAAAGLAGVGAYLAVPSLLRPSMPQIRSEMVKIQTVDSVGDPEPVAQQSVDYFTHPIDATAAIDFSVVPAGEFTMGSASSEPFRRDGEGPVFMRIRRFALGRTAVTQAQWAAVLARHPAQVRLPLPLDPASFKGADLPVETVSWQYATEFCARLSELVGRRCRLPSEAEWEYACRARTTTPFHYGPTLTPALANYCGTGGAVCGMSFGKDVSSLEYDGMTYPLGAYGDGPPGTFSGSTKPVRSFPPNRFGLFEMHGNVWEHCLDNWSDRIEDLPGDGSPYVGGRPDVHVLRGGSWSHHPAICRAAYRDRMDDTFLGWEGRVGFRVVCEI